MLIGQAIKDAAERAGLSVEVFRRKKGLPNTTFYALLRGELPAKVRTREVWRDRLKKAGVQVNGSI